MEQTKLDLIRQNHSYANPSYWQLYDGFYYGGFGLGLGWGWPYYGYYGVGPTVIYNVRPGYGREYHGGYHGDGGGSRGGFRR